MRKPCSPRLRIDLCSFTGDDLYVLWEKRLRDNAFSSLRLEMTEILTSNFKQPKHMVTMNEFCKYILYVYSCSDMNDLPSLPRG